MKALNEIICKEQVQSRRIVVPPQKPIKLDDKEPLRPETIDRNELALAFKVSRGRISEIMRVMNYLQTKFQSLDMEIKVTDIYLRLTIQVR
jgi:hypothetical protein